MTIYSLAFFALSLAYLWLLIAEVIGGVKKTRAGGAAHWEGFLNIFLLPFVAILAALAGPELGWMPPWYVVLLLCVLVDVAGFLAWWAACVITSDRRLEPGGSSS